MKTSAFFALSSPVADTIGEFNVTVGGIGTDAGFGAAQVSMVTKKGTNEYHGSVYWFQRTSFERQYLVQQCRQASRGRSSCRTASAPPSAAPVHPETL